LRLEALAAFHCINARHEVELLNDGNVYHTMEPQGLKEKLYSIDENVVYHTMEPQGLKEKLYSMEVPY